MSLATFRYRVKRKRGFTGSVYVGTQISCLFALLHLTQQVTKFSQVHLPPLDLGTTWSMVSSLSLRVLPQ